MKRKLISLAIIFAFTLTYCSFLDLGSTSAADMEYSYENKAAIFLSTVCGGEYYGKSKETVYTLDEQVFGYKVNTVNAKTLEEGYVIFNTEDGIVEYCPSSKGSAFDRYEGSKIYYNGNLDYYFQKDNAMISIKDGRPRSRADIFVNTNVKKIREEYFKEATASSVYAIDPPITNPSKTLTNVCGILTDNIPNYNSYTYVDKDAYLGYIFAEGPVAAVNMMIWYDNNGYPNLLTNGYPYIDCFNLMLGIMNFDNDEATVYECANGIYNYFHMKYPSIPMTKYIDLYITWSDIYGRVGQDIPSLYTLSGSSIYTTQTVMVVGYQKITTYWYNIIGVKCYSDHLFMNIVDGWVSSANRFINFDDASTRAMTWLA
jgi:hypothetical protein